MLKKGIISLIIIISGYAGFSQYSYFNHYKGWGVDVAVGYEKGAVYICPAYVQKTGRHYYRAGIEYLSENYFGLMAGTKIFPFDNKKKIRFNVQGMFEFAYYLPEDYASGFFVLPGFGIDYELSKEISIGTSVLVGPGIIWEKYITPSADPDYDPGVTYVPKWQYAAHFLITLEYTIKKRSHRGKI